MKKIGIIIPVHEFTDANEAMLTDALESCPNADGVSVIISCPTGEKKKAENFVGGKKGIGNPRIVASTEKSSFQALVNQAVDGELDYFTVLEMDDILSPNWERNARMYSEKIPDVSCYMTLTDKVDSEKNIFLSNMNEMAWWMGLSNELGYVDFDSLSVFYDYSMCGSLFNTKDFIDAGKLKESIEIYFWYEYLLRATYAKQKFYVIPKVGYVHTVNREGSLTKMWEGMNENDIKEWRNLAKREYFFKEDRGKGINS